ncbi:cell division protein PerM [Actinoplanes sp. CA-030573]|uniref:cell division protein PerM n=1 Tax=Actinoplanes sp. CA-030573 TaxID=3239898 RepID=UPI003D8ACCFB
MPTPPDRPESADDPFAVAEAALDARETVPLDRRTEPIGRPTEAVDRPTEATDRPAGRDRGTDGDRATVMVDDKVLGERPTVKVPGQRRPPPRGRRAPLPIAVAFATLWAAVLTYLPVAAVIGLARTLEGQGGLGGAAHAGLAGWLLGHGVPIGTSIGPLGLPPLLLTFLVIWRLNRAGLHVTRAIGARRSGRTGDALLVGFGIALVYSLLGSVAALAVDGKGTEVTPGRAAINFFVLGLIGALAGSLRGTDALSALARRTPRALRHGLRTGVMAALFILAAGAAITGLSVAVGGGQAADTISAYRTGVAGQAGITLLSLAYGANAAIWAAAYLLGPGFALGTGSAIGLTEVTAGPLPTLPLLAALPNGPMGAEGALLLAIPVAAGLAAGWLMTLRVNRTSDADPPWQLVLGSGLLAGPAAGVVLAVLARASGGPLGDGRLATIGPDPWQVGLVATAVVAVSAAIGAFAGRTFGPRGFRSTPKP